MHARRLLAEAWDRIRGECRRLPRLGVVLLALNGGALGSAALAQAPKPQRIVSLDLCADQLLIDLVPRARIAAVTHLAADASVSAIPDKARGLPVTHGGAEDVLQRNPDLVLAGPHGVADTVSLLERLGVKVEIVPLANDLDGVRRAVTIVAAATGEAERGRALLAEFDARLARVATLHAGGTEQRPRSALVYQVGGSTSLDGTLADAALRAAGYRNAGLDYRHARTGAVPLEAIVAHPPDLLVLASPPFAYRSVVADNLRHPALSALTARVQTLQLPWHLWLCGTPEVATAVEALAQANRVGARP